MKQEPQLLISPYGGQLVDLLVKGDERAELLQKASTYPTIQMTPRQTHDLELLAVGAFSPLDRFMGQDRPNEHACWKYQKWGSCCGIACRLVALPRARGSWPR